jgi:transcriptional regulator with XRE-family HTH domain
MSKLKEFRNHLNMSQEKFSLLLQIHRRTYACYEIQTRFPKAFNREKILKVAKEYNFPLHEEDLLRK